METRIARTMVWARAGLTVLLLAWADPGFLWAAEPETITDSEAYFPDTIGSRWEYRGSISDGPLQPIEHKGFVNTSTVQGTTNRKGVVVKVFHDSNPGNHGASDSFYRRDAVGIVYYGSDPGSNLDRQLTPYQIVRFPLVVPSSFEQFNRKGIDFGVDLDGDGQNEKADVQADVRLLAREAVTVPARTFDDAIRIEAHMRMLITFSKEPKTAVGTDTMTAWFARGVGLVKYVEYQELPAVRTNRGIITEIVEELAEASVKTAGWSEQGGEPAAQRVLAHHAGRHELEQIPFAAGLRTDARQPVAAEGLASDQRAGDRPVDVEIPDVKALAR